MPDLSKPPVNDRNCRYYYIQLSKYVYTAVLEHRKKYHPDESTHQIDIKMSHPGTRCSKVYLCQENKSGGQRDILQPSQRQHVGLLYDSNYSYRNRVTACGQTIPDCILPQDPTSGDLFIF